MSLLFHLNYISHLFCDLKTSQASFNVLKMPSASIRCSIVTDLDSYIVEVSVGDGGVVTLALSGWSLAMVFI